MKNQKEVEKEPSIADNVIQRVGSAYTKPEKGTSPRAPNSEKYRTVDPNVK